MNFLQIAVIGTLILSPQDSSFKKQSPDIKFDTIEKNLKEKDEYIRKMIVKMEKEIKEIKTKKK